jgi:hypothetical protein
MVEKGGVSKDMDIYVEQKIRIFCHLSKFEFCLLEESLVSLGRLCFTSSTVNKRKRS